MSGIAMKVVSRALMSSDWPDAFRYFMTWKTWSGVTSAPPTMRARRYVSRNSDAAIVAVGVVRVGQRQPPVVVDQAAGQTDGAHQPQHALSSLRDRVAHQNVPLLHVQQLRQQSERVLDVLEHRRDLAEGIEDVAAVERSEDSRQVLRRHLRLCDGLGRDDARQHLARPARVRPGDGQHLQRGASAVEIERTLHQRALAQVHAMELQTVHERRVGTEPAAAPEPAARRSRRPCPWPAARRPGDHPGIVGDDLLLEREHLAQIGQLPLGEAAGGRAPGERPAETAELTGEIAHLARQRPHVGDHSGEAVGGASTTQGAIEVLTGLRKLLELLHRGASRPVSSCPPGEGGRSRTWSGPCASPVRNVRRVGLTPP